MLVVKFKKVEEGMFISHLNMMRILSSIFKAANVQIDEEGGAITGKGVTYCSPTRVGIESHCEYICVDTKEDEDEFEGKIENLLPSWLKIEKIYETKMRPLLASLCCAASFDVTFDEYKTCKARIKEFFDQKEIELETHDGKKYNARERIFSVELKDDGFTIVAGIGEKSVRVFELVKLMLSYLSKSKNFFSIVKTKLLYREQDGSLKDISEMFE